MDSRRVESSKLSEQGPKTASDDPTLRLGRASIPKHPRPSWEARYEQHGELGRGGMATTREVFDRVTRRRVAMKVYEHADAMDGLAEFVAEAQVTAQLDHPNIVPVYDLEPDATGLPTSFTMKLVEGQTLDALILEEVERGGGLRPDALERLLGIVLKVCDAVAFAHSRGVIHRDLKPGNIMVGSHGQVYVMDWGIALQKGSDQAGTTSQRASGATALHGDVPGTLSGTPAFMAPEQALGRIDEIDERTDVYGLGGILYAILTQQPPHRGDSASHDIEIAKRGQVRRPEKVVSGARLPPGLCRIAMRALAPCPDDRYASVAELQRELEVFLRGGGWLETVRFGKGELIVREGDAPDAAYIVLAGHCEIFRDTGSERRFMRMMGPGEVFGEASIFGSSTRTASVAAATEVSALRVTRGALDCELGRSEWLRAFVEALAERFIELDRKLREKEDAGER